MKIVVEIKDGVITIKDDLGNEKIVKGVLLVGHDRERGQLYLNASGDPKEIAIGLGEGLSRVGEDPYYKVMYRSLLLEMGFRTGVLPMVKKTDPEEILDQWEKKNLEVDRTH